MAKKTPAKASKKKSTTPKKSSTVKGASPKSDKAKGAQKKKGAVKAASKKSAPKKAVHKKTTPKKAAPKPAASARKNNQKQPTLKDLLLKQFDRQTPEMLYQPAQDASQPDQFTAPPIVDPDTKQAQVIRSLLSKRFDLSQVTESKPAGISEKKADTAELQPPPDPRELLFRKFPVWTPDVTSGETEAVVEGDYSAPPIIDSDDEKASELKALLSRTFELPEPPPDPRELLFRKFPVWTPDVTSGETEAVVEGDYSAPPIIDSDDEKASEFKALLSRTFELPEPPPDPRELLFRKFPVWTPDVTAGETEAVVEGDYSAPPIIDPDDEKASELKALLSRTFEIPKPPPDPKELMFRKFPVWTPDLAAAQSETVMEVKYSAPPIIDPDDKNADRIRTLLSKTFDLTDVPASEPPEPQSPEPVKKEEKVESRPSEAEESKDMKEPSARVEVTYPKTTDTKGADPMEKTLKYAIAGFVLLLALVIGVSYSNSCKYYLRPADKSLEIWKGIFAPIGKDKLLAIPVVHAPENIKPVYTKEEVYPLAANYFLNKADQLMDTSGTPDFQKIRSMLYQAMTFASSQELKQATRIRIDNVDLMLLFYKADAAATKGTKSGIEQAIQTLKKASALKLQESQAKIVEDRIGYFENRLKEME